MSKIAAEKLVLSVYLPYTRKGIVTQHSGLILPVTAPSRPANKPLFSTQDKVHL